jgi:peptide maturation system acyl carrier-related protein
VEMDNSAKLAEIRNRLNGIIKVKFNLDLDDTGQNLSDSHLLSKEINLAPRDLLYLFSDIEKEFAITIPEQEVVAGNFNSFNNIVTIIHQRLGLKT